MLNKGREGDILLDRLKLFERLIIEDESSNLVLDMRHLVYLNILTSIAKEYQTLSISGNLSLLLEYISDLETFFTREITIGGSKRQVLIEAPAWLNEEFLVDESEFEFEAPKSLENTTNNIISPIETSADINQLEKNKDSSHNPSIHKEETKNEVEGE